MSRSAKRVWVAGSLTTALLTGCYVVPVAPDGTPLHGAAAFAVPVAPAAVYAAPMPGVLQARLYPSNDVASQDGMLAGTVTSMMPGKGRFQLQYQGEVLIGEATRVPGDDRSGVANAYGQRGTYMKCSYRMTTPYQGTGTCTMSTGATYSVHLGMKNGPEGPLLT
jgi:hypothetical protein